MKTAWLLGLLGLCACGSAPAEQRQQMTEFRLYRTMGCYDTALQANGAQIDINPDGTIEISTWTGQQASHTPSNEVGRRLYGFGLDLKNPIYVEPKASNRYMAVVGVVKDLKARGYRHVRLVDLPE